MENTTNRVRGWASGEIEMKRNLGRNQDFDIQAQLPTLPQLRDRTRCSRCNHDERRTEGRNLVVCLDGTTNQFGSNNTNVLEFCSRVKKDDLHELLYLSGIGTLPEAKPPLGQRWDQITDLLFAHTFNQRVLAGYRWLSNMYRPGDKIFIYGFSRGAYQAMALAAMIDTVGLLRRHNEQQLPFALEMYLKCETEDYKERAKNFKKALSWDIRVHFLGLWDTVSSLGKGRKCPRTDNLHEFVCYIRHALALDELRVKFIPEFLGGNTPLPDGAYENSEDGITRVKEVWFAGSHSDVGGGNVPNVQLNNASVPVLWMVNQSIAAGLSVEPSGVILSDAKLRNMQTNDSMTFWYRILEFLPLHWSTHDERKKKRRLHRSSPRVIKPTQKLHISICFIDGYEPLATPCNLQMKTVLDKMVGQGKLDKLDWIDEPFAQHLEKDLFDITQIREIFGRWAASQDQDSQPDVISDLQRLVFLASVREGAQAILQDDDNLKKLLNMIKRGVPSAQDILYALLKNGWKQSVSRLGSQNFIELLEQANKKDEHGRFAPLLDMFAEEYGALPLGKFRTMSDLRASIVVEGEVDPPTDWIKLSLVCLYFGRYMESKVDGDLQIAQKYLREHLSASSPPHSVKTAPIENWLATTLEAEGTKTSLEEALKMRTELVKLCPDGQYDRDLANTRLILKTSEVEERSGGTFVVYPYITTRSKRALINEDREFAKLLTNLSNRFHDLGQKEDALETVERSIEMFNRGASVGLATNDADMATAMNNQSNHLASKGKRESALEIMGVVIWIRRALFDDLNAKGSDTERCRRDLAISLHNRAIRRSDMGQKEGALADIKGAVEFGRQLAADQPHIYNADLAGYLANLSICQWQCSSEHREDALRTIKEAVSLYRPLAKEQPNVFNQTLAMSLTNLSHCQSALGLHEDALVAINEAVSLQRQLAKDRPQPPHIHNVVLARSLIVLSNRQSNLRHTKDALRSIQEAISLYEPLAVEQPDVYNTDLAMALHNLSLRQSDLGQDEDSRKSAMDAFLLDEQLATERPDVYNADLAKSLSDLGLGHRKESRYKEALKPAGGAVSLYRRIATEQPHVYKSRLADSLNGLSVAQSGLGYHEVALESQKEAVSLRRQLANQEPLVHNKNLAIYLNNLSLNYSKLKHYNDALDSALESLLIFRDLSPRPSGYEKRIVDGVTRVKRCLSALGRRADADKFTVESLVVEGGKVVIRKDPNSSGVATGTKDGREADKEEVSGEA